MRAKVYRFLRHKERNRFLNMYARLGTIAQAAEACGISRQAHYLWLKDVEYAIAFGEAQQMARDLLEEEAHRRAVEGVERPVFYKGSQVAVVREYSDQLLTLLLKGAFPQKYRERVQQEVVGDGAAEIRWEGDETDDEADRVAVPAGSDLAQ